MGEVALPLDESHSLAGLRSGDEGAFLELVGKNHAAMVRVARAFVRSDAVAEEVAQESWLAVLEGLGGFEARSSLRSWIFSIVANRARTRAQRESRFEPVASFEEQEEAPAVDPSRFLPQDSPLFPGNWSSPPQAWPEERLLMRETLELAGRAIDELPPAQRQVIVLRDVEGCSAGEVCEALDLSEGNQRVLLHRARSKVRGALESHLGSGK